jgi:hypothetical protein
LLSLPDVAKYYDRRIAGEENMFGRARVLIPVAACALATLAGAQAQVPTTAFDGKYVGVSRESAKAASNPGAKCPPNGVPAPLTVRNGVIGKSGGAGWEGTVSPQGTLVMHNAGSMRVDGQIDPQGTVTAKYSGPACIVSYVWRKRAA